mmetsp:Transcript_85028/g.237243  ORF Transcript_85028/g.237243 Transcript_85028/m.237243 type:complete len:222 (-) Transcript_85028:8-673(-)
MASAAGAIAFAGHSGVQHSTRQSAAIASIADATARSEPPSRTQETNTLGFSEITANRCSSSTSECFTLAAASDVGMDHGAGTGSGSCGIVLSNCGNDACVQAVGASSLYAWCAHCAAAVTGGGGTGITGGIIVSGPSHCQHRIRQAAIAGSSTAQTHVRLQGVCGLGAAWALPAALMRPLCEGCDHVAGIAGACCRPCAREGVGAGGAQDNRECGLPPCRN